MDNLFTIQLVTSFVVGGSFIALQSFLAEKVNKNLSGLIISFPSTAALGFFFLGWTLSPQIAAEVVPATLLQSGVSVLFASVYVTVAQKVERVFDKKILHIGSSFIVGILFWSLFAIPIAHYQFSNLLIGLMGSFVLLGIGHALLHRKEYEKPKGLKYKPSQIVGRAVFAGFIVALVVFLGKVVGSFWGAIFTMFPASFSSALMVFHWYYKAEDLFPMMQKIAIGTLAILTYVLVVMFMFPKVGFIWGTVYAFAASLLATLLIRKFS